LVLGDSYMQICRGTTPSDFQGFVWGMNFSKGDINSNYIATKGKYGRNWISNGQTLAAGDWVGSPGGYAALIMQSDGNLVLQTFQMVSNCSKMADGNTGGKVGANATYRINQTAIPANMGKLAFVDANADLHLFPDAQQTYANTYSLKQNMYSPDTEIPDAAFDNATVETCQSACNANPDCAGFVTNKAGTSCWPQTNQMFPFGGNGTANMDRNSYIRNKVPTVPPTGASLQTNSIDTVTYQNYVDGGSIQENKYGLVKATTAQKQQLEQMEAKLNLLSKQLNDSTNEFQMGSSKSQDQSQRNVAGLNSYISDLNENKKNIDWMSTNSGMQNVVNETDIVVLQKNYEYIFWSILAAGTVLVAMNIAH
jgi:hypothetical protein